MTQCTATAMKPRYSKNSAIAMFIGYERGQCSRKAKVGSLCTQHENKRLADIRIEERTARRVNPLAEREGIQTPCKY